MTEPDVQEFVGLLRKSRLLDATGLRKVERQVEHVGNSTALADALVADGLLTAWQRDQLLQRQTGFVLRKYRLLSPVGRGGMGHVFRARDDRSGQIVAIKVMARKLSGNKVLVDRFRREIRASSQLQSPHVVRAVDAGRVGRVDFMVMEYVNGDQLDQIADRVPVLPTGLACEIIRQAAIGLQHAHQQRMVHRDIKPSNLIVGWNKDGSGTVKVMDLGLVRLEQEDLDQRSVTRTGQVMGTPDYMSPEQAWNTARADIRSDIYSLGCTFFRLITGRVPFPGDNPLQVLMARCSRDVPPAGSVRGDIPEAVQAVIARMTRRDPAARYQTPGEVADALADWCAPLTREALREAARTASAVSADDDEIPSAEAGGPGHDVDYEQFLQEMGDDEAVVDLMTADENGQGAEATLPDAPLPTLVSESPAWTPRGGRRRPRAVRRPWLLPAAATAGVGLSAVLLAFAFRPTDSDSAAANTGGDASVVDSGETPPAWKLPEMEFERGPVRSVRSGDVLRLTPDWSLTRAGSGGSLVFSLADDAPAGATVDPATGEIHWPTSPLTSPGEYELPLVADWEDATRAVRVGEWSLPVEVTPGPLAVTLDAPPPQRVMPGDDVRIPVVSPGFSASNAGGTFRLIAGSSNAMRVDPNSGTFSWTPTENDVGRHEVQLALFDNGTGKQLASTRLRLLVIPSSFRVTLPDFPEQQATAGQRFELALADRPLPERGVSLKLGDAAPSGVKLDASAGRLTWDVPPDAAGRYEIPLTAEPAGPRFELTPDSRTSTTIVIRVAAAAPVSRAPDDAAVADADRELRELFRRDLTTARSAAARAELAASLLERSYDQSAGPDDFAMLNLAAELADRASAWDLLMETELHRRRRYATDDGAAITPVLPRLRRSASRTVQQDLLVEHCLRLAKDRADSDRFADAAEFLAAADQLLRKSGDVSGARQMAGDVAQARDISEALGRAEDPADDALRRTELARLLDAWQFHELFSRQETLAFLQDSNSTTPLPENGRSLWTFQEGRLTMASPPRDGLTGFLESTRRPERWVVRLHVSPRTTSASLIFGGRVGTDLSGFLLVLDDSGFGRLQQMPGPKPLRDAPDTVPLNATLPNLVEVAGTGRQLTVRVNGTPVYSTRLPEDAAGQIGLLCSLVRPDPGAVVDIRRPRVLVLPDRN